MLRVVKLSFQATGPVPTDGLLVSNHLSYLDILVIASLTRAAFVSKHELKYWPVLGWLACAAGTLFVNRARPSLAGRAVSDLQTAMGNGVLVVLFPEGTSSDGSGVLPFKSSMLEPVVRQDHPVSVSRIRYELDDGDVGEDVCYWKDMIFVPHLIKLLSKRSIRAFVRFSPAQVAATDRKQLARELHSAVVRLHEDTFASSTDIKSPQ
jgi:1-acyl-sn-glycerol-3-phosphate acyltransferase